MKNFYENIFGSTSTIDTTIIGGSFPLNRKIFKTYYRDQLVCPACDGAPAPVHDQSLDTDVDHFFPIHKYPLFAVHPLNLIPYCKYCNQPTYKGEKDVLDTIGIRSMQDIFHPYRPARDSLKFRIVDCSHVINDLDELLEKNNLDGQKQKTLQTIKANGGLSLLVSAHSGSQRQVTRRNSINFLFKLQDRWNGELGQVCSDDQEIRPKVDIRVQNILQDMARGAYISKQNERATFTPDMEWLKMCLESFKDQNYIKPGGHPGAITEITYSCWLLSNEPKMEVLLEKLKLYCKSFDATGSNFAIESRQYKASMKLSFAPPKMVG